MRMYGISGVQLRMCNNIQVRVNKFQCTWLVVSQGKVQDEQ